MIASRCGSRWFAIALVAAIAVAPSIARAGDRVVEAEAIFRDGSAAYARGSFLAAAIAFEEANRLAPSAATLYNAGLAWQRANSPERAADAFAAALRDASMDPHGKDDARVRLHALEEQVATIDVAAPPGSLISVAHIARAPAPLHVHVVAGAVDVTNEMPGKQADHRIVHVAAGESTKVTFDEPSGPVAPAGPAHIDDVTPPLAIHHDASARRTIGFIAVGAAALFAAGGIAFGLRGESARDAFVASASHDVDAHDRAVSSRTIANVAWTGAAVLGVTGAVLVVTSFGGDSASTVSASIGPREAWVRVHF